MADADWASYKQLRGRPLPERIEFRGACYRQEKLFKRDFYAATGLFHIDEAESIGDLPARIVLKVYHTEPLGIFPLRWLGRMLCNREVFNLQNFDGVPGLARLVGRYGDSGFLREYVPGCDLREYQKTRRPNEDFYPKVRAMLEAIHNRNMSHNDLSKPENILVRPDGSPTIIDFQIAASFSWRWPLLKPIGRRLLRYMQSVDRYHLRKLHRRDRPQDFTSEELRQARTKGIVLTAHGWLLRKPYRAVRHFILNRFMRVRHVPVIPVDSKAIGTESSRSTAAPPPSQAA